MAAALFSHALAGVLGGLLAGLVDAFPAGITAGPRALLGGLGLGALLGGLGGALWGLSAAGRPALDLRQRARTLARLVWPRPHHALHDRTRTVATAWVLGLALGLGGPVLSAAGVRVLGRLQSALFAGLAVALVGLAVVGTLAALGLAARGALARGLEVAARRWPRAMAPVVFPAGHLLAVGALGLLRVQGWAAAAAPGTVDVAARVVVAGVGGVAVAALCVGPLRRGAARAKPVAAAAVMLAGTMLAVALLRGGLAEEGARAALAQQAGVTGLVARALGAPAE